MDLARDRSVAVIVDAVLTKDFPELYRLLMLRPVLDFAHERWLEVLEAARLVLKLAAHPLNGAGLIDHEEAQLAKLGSRVSFAVVLGDLRWQEVHAVTLGIALVHATQKLRGRKRHEELARHM